jgi:CRISPR-associated endonuclease/helicase Cas3
MLLDYIVAEQKRCGDSRPLRVLQLSATNRNGAAADDSTPPLRLSEADKANETVRRRIHATKQLRLTAIADEKQLADQVSELSLARRNSGRAVLIFARSIEAVQKIESAIGKAKLPIVVLTGTMRGKERDKLVKDSTFLRFLPPSPRPGLRRNSRMAQCISSPPAQVKSASISRRMNLSATSRLSRAWPSGSGV